MAGKTPGSPRKSTSSRKAPAKKASTVTPIDQGSPQNQGSPQSGNNAATAATDEISSRRRESPATGVEVTGARANESRAAEASSRPAEFRSVETPIRPAETSTRETSTRNAGPELLEQIRARAYELFEQRGRKEGFDQQDWAQAEAEIMARSQREKSA